MSRPKLAEIKPARAEDVPACLRRVADRVERGEYGEIRFVAAVFVGARDTLACFGWGRASDLEVAGAFSRAAVLSSCMIPDIDGEPGDAA